MGSAWAQPGSLVLRTTGPLRAGPNLLRGGPAPAPPSPQLQRRGPLAERPSLPGPMYRTRPSSWTALGRPTPPWANTVRPVTPGSKRWSCTKPSTGQGRQSASNTSLPASLNRSENRMRFSIRRVHNGLPLAFSAKSTIRDRPGGHERSHSRMDATPPISRMTQRESIRVPALRSGQANEPGNPRRHGRDRPCLHRFQPDALISQS